MDRTFTRLGAAFGFLGVAIGAFAAHGLEDRLSPEALGWVETGAQYQLLHALALLATAVAAHAFPGRLTRFAGWAFVVGVLLFSGSLYALAATDVRALGAVTPIGGLGFLVGWACLAGGSFKSSRSAAGA